MYAGDFICWLNLEKDSVEREREKILEECLIGFEWPKRQVKEDFFSFVGFDIIIFLRPPNDEQRTQIRKHTAYKK